MEKLKEKYQSLLSQYKTLAKFFDALFLILMAFYVFGCVIQTTTFEVYFGATISAGAVKLMFWVAMIRICFLLQNWKELAAALGYGLVLYVIYCMKADSLLFFIGIMAFGTFRLELEKVLKVHFVTVGFTVLVAIVASLT